MNNDEARLWEIAENLHRAELTKLERDENIAEWIKITEKIHASQLATHQKAGQQPGGINAASRELGIDRDDAHRAVKISKITEDAKEALRETDLDNNRKAMLEVASAPPEEQAARVHELAAAKAGKKKPGRDDDEVDIASPEVIEDNILHVIGGMNENARVFNKLLRISAMDREAAARIGIVIDRAIKKWRSIQSTLEKKAR
jgi:hypothetical protein